MPTEIESSIQQAVLSFRRPTVLACGAGMDDAFLPKADWHDLLCEIHNHQVIPIVGPEMVTVREPPTGISIPLYRALAPKLAPALLPLNSLTRYIYDVPPHDRTKPARRSFGSLIPAARLAAEIL